MLVRPHGEASRGYPAKTCIELEILWRGREELVLWHQGAMAEIVRGRSPGGLECGRLQGIVVTTEDCAAGATKNVSRRAAGYKWSGVGLNLEVLVSRAEA